MPTSKPGPPLNVSTEAERPGKLKPNETIVFGTEDSGASTGIVLIEKMTTCGCGNIEQLGFSEAEMQPGDEIWRFKTPVDSWRALVVAQALP